MLNRWLGISAALLMLAANAAIFCHDIVPGWFAGDPPRTDADALAPGQERSVQVGIYDDAGRTIGRSWTRSRRMSVAGIVPIKTTTLLEAIHLPGGVVTPRVRIEMELTFRSDQKQVDELEFKMHGLGMPITLHCESSPTGDFPCMWQVGAEHGDIALNSTAPAALGDVIRPFDRLPDLYVGRSWRLKLLDPLAQLVPSMEATGLEFEPVLIQVTGKETIQHRGIDVEVFVVEGGGATAWVAKDGTVLQQVVNLPLVGRLTLLDEPFDDDALAAAGKAVPPEEVRALVPRSGAPLP